MKYIVINNEDFYSIDTRADLATAAYELGRAGLAAARIWDGDGPDAVETSRRVFADGYALVYSTSPGQPIRVIRAKAKSDRGAKIEGKRFARELGRGSRVVVRDLSRDTIRGGLVIAEFLGSEVK